jgi:serine/threonine protein kinase
VFEEFQVLLLLGRGAFASVFLARQISMQRRVALKITSIRWKEHSILGQFDHPNVVRIYDQRELRQQGWRLLYMQYVPGGTLRKVVEQVRGTSPQHRTGRLLFEVIDANLTTRGEPVVSDAPLREHCETASWPEVVCWLGARIARGLSHAHDLGVLHCDLKPANVLLAADGTPKLADFNVSFDPDNSSEESEMLLGGSLAYMSPEQLEAYNPQHARTASNLDGRSDLYSLGVTLHELLLGTRPFPAEKVHGKFPEVLDRMAAVRREGLPASFWSQAGAGWPPGLSQVLARLLAPEPAQRYASGQELARRLEICLQPLALEVLFPQPHQWRGRLRRWSGTALFLLVLAPHLLVVWFHFQFPLQPAKDFSFSNGLSWVITMPAWVLLLGGLLLCLWRGWPVIRAVQSSQSDAPLSDSASQALRTRCLRLGPETAAISLGTWMVLSLGTALALRLIVGADTAGQASQFATSALLGGLIAVAYPYCGVSWLAVCGLYPGLIQPERFTAADQREIGQLLHESWLFLLLAAVMPLAAIALTMFLNQDQFALKDQSALIGFTIVGIVGLFLSMMSFRALQHDLQVMLWMSASRPDSHNSLDNVASWFGSHQ